VNRYGGGRGRELKEDGAIRKMTAWNGGHKNDGWIAVTEGPSKKEIKV
jgi:hypothetical protein